MKILLLLVDSYEYRLLECWLQKKKKKVVIADFWSNQVPQLFNYTN